MTQSECFVGFNATLICIVVEGGPCVVSRELCAGVFELFLPNKDTLIACLHYKVYRGHKTRG